MHNTAMNYMKCNFLHKKDKKIAVYIFNSDQNNFKNKVINSIIEKNKENSSRQIEFFNFTNQRNIFKEKKLTNYLYQKINLFEKKNLSQFFETTEKKKKIILIGCGIEMLLNTKKENDLKLFFKNLKKNSFTENTKAVHLFIFHDQLQNKNLFKTLTLNISILFDFRKSENKDKFLTSVINYSEITKKNIIEGKFDNEILVFQKYIPENTKIEEKNPDQFINSTFKLGFNSKEKNVKDKLILPFYKDKQIREMREKEEMDGVIDLGEDDEEFKEFDEFDV